MARRQRTLSISIHPDDLAKLEKRAAREGKTPNISARDMVLSDLGLDARGKQIRTIMHDFVDLCASHDRPSISTIAVLRILADDREGFSVAFMARMLALDDVEHADLGGEG